ncbi:MAG: Pyridoxamine 5'-phosphate oxidase, partial [uncultured Rubellimicrobium sp.]
WRPTPRKPRVRPVASRRWTPRSSGPSRARGARPRAGTSATIRRGRPRPGARGARPRAGTLPMTARGRPRPGARAGRP